MGYTILHLSDLHRRSDQPITNDQIVSALLADAMAGAREVPSIPPPDAIVVTGDLVEGARLDSLNPSSTLRAQWEGALDLLDRLSRHFLAGDRTRLVIVPGNHDVDWPTARDAMQLSDHSHAHGSDSPDRFGPQGTLRWDWTELCAYQIVDLSRYEERLSPFRKAASEFYSSSPGLQSPFAHDDFHRFELCEGRIGLVAFNSCYGNDCFSRAGCISPDSVARAHLDLVELGPTHDLLIAAWHHNVEGPPSSGDYMDVSTVYDLSSKGFRLGLHGHQHRSHAVTRVLQLANEAPIGLVSAGSLSVRPTQLPTGVNHQYNYVELSEQLDRATIHVREAQSGLIFGPSRRLEFGSNSSIELKLVPSNPGKVAADGRRSNRDIRAESALMRGDPHLAVQLEADSDLSPGTYARKLQTRALKEIARWHDLVTLLTPPATLGELLEGVDAFLRLHNPEGAASFLHDYGHSLGLDHTLESDLNDRIAIARITQ